MDIYVLPKKMEEGSSLAYVTQSPGMAVYIYICMCKYRPKCVRPVEAQPNYDMNIV